GAGRWGGGGLLDRGGTPGAAAGQAGEKVGGAGGWWGKIIAKDVPRGGPFMTAVLHSALGEIRPRAPPPPPAPPHPPPRLPPRAPARGSWACAGGCWAITPTRRTPSRPPSSSSPKRLASPGGATASPAGFTASPGAVPTSSAPAPPAGKPMSARPARGASPPPT